MSSLSERQCWHTEVCLVLLQNVKLQKDYVISKGPLKSPCTD